MRLVLSTRETRSRRKLCRQDVWNPVTQCCCTSTSSFAHTYVTLSVSHTYDWGRRKKNMPGLIHDGLVQCVCVCVCVHVQAKNEQQLHQSLERQWLGETPLWTELWVVHFDKDALFDQTLVRFFWAWVGLILGHVSEPSFSKNPAKSV